LIPEGGDPPYLHKGKKKKKFSGKKRGEKEQRGDMFHCKMKKGHTATLGEKRKETYWCQQDGRKVWSKRKESQKKALLARKGAGRGPTTP